MSEWLKLPGLFHRFELEQVIDADGRHEYLFERAGDDAQGRELIAVYCRHSQVTLGSAVVVAPLNSHLPVENCIGGAQ